MIVDSRLTIPDFQIPNRESSIGNRQSYTALRHQAGEMLERTVIGSLRICGKEASGKFPAAQVVLQARTTCAFLRTRFIRAIAIYFILFLIAFHN
jgi:hypothetical protein